MDNLKFKEWVKKQLGRIGPIESAEANGASYVEIRLNDLFRRVDQLGPRQLDLLEQYITSRKAMRSTNIRGK